MIIVAGAGPRTEKYRANKPEYCYHCGNTSRWILQKTRYFVTLFFLPVVPFKTEYSYSCPVCGNTIALTKEEFEEKVRDAERV